MKWIPIKKKKKKFKPNHSFNQHARITLIEQLDNVNIDVDLETLQLKKHEDC